MEVVIENSVLTAQKTPCPSLQRQTLDALNEVTFIILREAKIIHLIFFQKRRLHFIQSIPLKLAYFFQLLV